MKAILNYLQNNILALLITFGVFFIAYAVFFTNANWSIGQYIVSIIFVVACIHKRRERKLKEEQLHKKGLTTGDLLNIEFVKNWEKDRLVGRTRYCLQNGGVVMGMMLIVPISFIALLVTSISGTFASMNVVTAFLLLLVPLCYTSATLIYLIRWNNKERKFQKLTGESYLVK